MIWLVARTRSNSERRAAENIKRQGYNFYLPRYLAQRAGSKGLGRAVEAYLFPTYIFVEVDLQWRWLLATTGVTSVIVNGDRPATMPFGNITEMRCREDEEGWLLLPQFKPDAPVKVLDGPFVGFAGIVEGMPAKDRVTVLLDILGRKTRAVFAKDQLTVAA